MSMLFWLALAGLGGYVLFGQQKPAVVPPYKPTPEPPVPPVPAYGAPPLGKISGMVVIKPLGSGSVQVFNAPISVATMAQLANSGYRFPPGEDPKKKGEFIFLPAPRSSSEASAWELVNEVVQEDGMWVLGDALVASPGMAGAQFVVVPKDNVQMYAYPGGLWAVLFAPKDQ